MLHPSNLFGTRAGALLVLCFCFVVLSPRSGTRAQQGVDSYDLSRWSNALGVVKNDVFKNYYDPTFRGLNIEAHFKDAREKMGQARSLSQLFVIIAQALLEFDDSHLYFIPPERSSLIEYGWRVSMIGDRAVLTMVKPGSDAAAKGLKLGDEVITLDGNPVNRQTLWKLRYLYYSLRPAERVRFQLASPGGSPRTLDILTKITPRKKVLDLTGSDADINSFIDRMEEDEHDRAVASRWASLGDNAVMVWKLKEFAHTQAEIDRTLSNARKHKGLVIDLRGDGGGSEETLLRILGNLFDHDVTIGQIKGRTGTKPLIAKTRGAAFAYAGDLVILVDSESGSASELLARVVQLEKRGIVMGDRTSGKVMRSRLLTHESGLDVIATYAVSVTDADIVMKDGQSLEKTGVTPDAILLPSSSDLAARRDPVLSAAVGRLGSALAAEDAGAIFETK